MGVTQIFLKIHISLPLTVKISLKHEVYANLKLFSLFVISLLVFSLLHWKIAKLG